MKLDTFLLVPPASFVIKDSDGLMMLGKSEDIRKIKALKQKEVVLILFFLLLKPGGLIVEVDEPTADRE